MRYLQRKVLLFVEWIIIVGGIAIKATIDFAKDRPVQFLAPIGVFICSIIMITTNNPVLVPILFGIQAILLSIQFHAMIKLAKKTNQRHAREDKERFQTYLEFGGMPGIQFLSIYKNPWLQVLYYRLRGITRLSLFKYGKNDNHGSHTKFKVNAKQLFHLQLKGCINTEDLNKAIEGIDYIAKEYLTK